MSQLIYFALAKKTQTVKIGRSFKPVERVKTIDGMTPQKVVLLGVMEGHERSVHRLFGEDKTEPSLPMHEWFHFSRSLRNYVKKNTVPAPFAGRHGVKDPLASKQKRKCIRCQHIQPIRKFRPKAVVCNLCVHDH